MRDFNIQKQPKKVQNENYWRYKKKTAPEDEFADLNGPVIIKKPKKKVKKEHDI